MSQYMVVQKRTAFPKPKKDNYIANDPIDLTLPAEKKVAFKAGSLVCSGYLNVRTAVTTYNGTISGTILNQNSQIFLNRDAGVHALFDNWTVEMGGKMAQNLSEYGRLAAMVNQATNYKDDEANDTVRQAALITGDKDFGRNVLLPLSGDSTYTKVWFEFKPILGLNMSSDDIPFRRSGPVKINTILTQLSDAFHGSGWASTCGYWISDLRFDYEVVPDKGSDSDSQIVMQNFTYAPDVANSNNSNLDAMVSALANSAAVTFRQVNREAARYTEDMQQLDVVPGVSRVLFAFNDNDTSRITYPIDNKEELLMNYLLALGVNNVNSATLARRNQTYGTSSVYGKANGFGVGVTFGTLRNLTNSKFDIQMITDSTGPTNTNRYRSFIFARGLVAV